MLSHSMLSYNMLSHNMLSHNMLSQRWIKAPTILWMRSKDAVHVTTCSADGDTSRSRRRVADISYVILQSFMKRVPKYKTK